MSLSWKVHAVYRLEERSNLSVDEVHKIVTDNKYIPLGIEPGTDKVHWLIYSPEEELWHVLVVDEVKQEIVTVLPPDFRGRFEISQEAFKQAKALWVGCKPTQKSKKVKPNRAPQQPPAPTYKLRGTLTMQARPTMTFSLPGYPIGDGTPKETLTSVEFCRYVVGTLMSRYPGHGNILGGELVVLEGSHRHGIILVKIPLDIMVKRAGSFDIDRYKK